jgi:hypothetical protein
MRAAAAHFNDRPRHEILAAPMLGQIGGDGPKICPSCRGRKVDRFGFDCTTCLGEGEVDE